MELIGQGAVALSRLIREKKVSARELCEEHLRFVEERDASIGAFLSLDAAGALAQAGNIDKMVAAGTALPPLAGVPVGLKANICVQGHVTNCASRMLRHFVPSYDATVVEKLRRAGAVLLGSLNMDEFAIGSSCEHSAFKTTRNPWDSTRVPGGSSGGSAAAVAACELPLALGSDAGGSIRTPAAFCGVVGLKPSYGAVSRYGLIAFASSLEQIGPLGRTVDDVSLLYSVICGEDRQRDATSRAFPFAQEAGGAGGLRIGILMECSEQGVAPEVEQAVLQAAARFRELGAAVDVASLPSAEHALSAFYVISSAEAASNLARYDGVAHGEAAPSAASYEELVMKSRGAGFGDEVKRRILLGTLVLSSGHHNACYGRARLMQQQIKMEFSCMFEKYDLLIAPTTSTTAFPMGARLNDPTAMYATDSCSIHGSLAGLPALSVPCGFDGDGLPIGMQLVGPKGSEGRLLAAAKDYEQLVNGFAGRGWPR